MRKSKTYKLVFDDPDFDGLEVRTKGASIGTLLEITRLTQEAASNDDQKVRALLDKFASVLVSWNLEDEADDGTRTPVPATLDGLLAQDQQFVEALVTGWLEAVSGVDADTKAHSSGGGPSPVVSLPMEALSESP